MLRFQLRNAFLMVFGFEALSPRFHKTILREFYSIALRKKIYLSLEELQKDLDSWIDKYNNQRPHQGKRCQGRTPMQTFQDGRSLYQKYVFENSEEEKEQI